MRKLGFITKYHLIKLRQSILKHRRVPLSIRKHLSMARMFREMVDSSSLEIPWIQPDRSWELDQMSSSGRCQSHLFGDSMKLLSSFSAHEDIRWELRPIRRSQYKLEWCWFFQVNLTKGFMAGAENFHGQWFIYFSSIRGRVNCWGNRLFPRNILEFQRGVRAWPLSKSLIITSTAV